MDKLADGLQKLNEDDLLQVVQMVHDNKSADSYTKNDAECESFISPPYPLFTLRMSSAWMYFISRSEN